MGALMKSLFLTPSGGMGANYLKIAWRNLLRNKVYSIINIFGLSAGIAFTMLISAYVWCELEVNSTVKNAKNQYIIQSNWKDKNAGIELTTFGPLAKTLKEQYPQLVANYYRFDAVTVGLTVSDKNFREGLQIGDSTLLNMYGFKLKYGKQSTALNQPFTIVITEEKALKYFGKSDVLGKTISIENFTGVKHDFLISGILEKLKS